MKNPRVVFKTTGRMEPAGRVSIIGRYLEDLEGCRPIPVQEEHELVRRFKRGEQGALHQLIKANLRFVIKIAKRYQGRCLRRKSAAIFI